MNEVWKKPPISFEAYQAMVGKETGVSSWHLIDQNRINVYADVIEDHQFIHVDPERAKKETAFGNTIAHGFLTMSLMSIMSYEVMPVIEGTAMGVNYGFDKLRFLSPVRAGSRVRGRNLYRDWSGKRFAEDYERTRWRAFNDIGRQLSIAQRFVAWVREQLDRAMQSQLICQSFQELSGAVHPRQNDNRRGFGRAHAGAT